MKVILQQELQGKGGEGDVIDVARGFAVNYLLPRGIAIEATKGNLKQLEMRRHNIQKRELARTTDASAIKEGIDGKTINAPMRVGEEGQLYGSVTGSQIAALIAEQLGPTVDRKRIVIHHPIKRVGIHEVTIDVYREIKALVYVNVYDESGAPTDNAGAEEAAEAEKLAAAQATPEESAEQAAAVAVQTAGKLPSEVTAQ